MSFLFKDDEYPADPYPGTRPDCSFVHLDGAGYPLETAPEGWRDRQPVLSYGSNACPSKITWLREEFGMTGPVVVVKVECTGLAAMWAAGRRHRDGQRPATLGAAPGVVERHAVWFATPGQLSALDLCEGRGGRYELVRLNSGTITMEDGTVLDDVLAYTGCAEIRLPLLVDGKPVRVTEMAQREASALVGVAAESHGLDVTVLPHPDGLTFP